MPHATVRMELSAEKKKDFQADKKALQNFLEAVAENFCQLIDASNFRLAFPTGEGENFEKDGQIKFVAEVEFWNYGPETKESEDALEKAVKEVLPEWANQIVERISDLPTITEVLDIVYGITVTLELVDVSAEETGIGGEGSED